MKNPQKKKLTNALLTVEPGRYLTVRGEAIWLYINEPTPGIVLDTTADAASEASMSTVLVNGNVIRLWHEPHEIQVSA